MTRRLAVFMGDRRAGTLECEARASTFEYDRAYIEPGSTPLSLSMPVGPGAYGPAIVEPFLWGLLPDDPDTLQRWAVLARPQADEHNPFSLLEHYGRDCAGAIQFLPEGEHPDAAGEVHPIDERAIADQLRALHSDPNAWTFDETEGRFSLAGAQAKFALTWKDGGWGRPIGSTPTTHIFKPGIPEFREQALNEHVCMTLAARAGLPVAPTEIRSYEGSHAIVVARYDRRRRADGTIERLHQEDLCQALSVSPSQKYQDDGGPGIQDIVGLIRRVQRRDQADATARRFLLAVAYNWAIGGTDAHAKNYSVLLQRRSVALAPLYDVASLTPYDRYHPNSAKLAQSVDRRYRFVDVDVTAWIAQANAVGLDGDEFLDDVRALVARVADGITDCCFSPEVLDIDADFAGMLRGALDERLAAARRQLA